MFHCWGGGAGDTCASEEMYLQSLSRCITRVHSRQGGCGVNRNRSGGPYIHTLLACVSVYSVKRRAPRLCKSQQGFKAHRELFDSNCMHLLGPSQRHVVSATLPAHGGLSLMLLHSPILTTTPEFLYLTGGCDSGLCASRVVHGSGAGAASAAA